MVNDLYGLRRAVRNRQQVKIQNEKTSPAVFELATFSAKKALDNADPRRRGVLKNLTRSWYMNKINNINIELIMV